MSSNLKNSSFKLLLTEADTTQERNKKKKKRRKKNFKITERERERERERKREDEERQYRNVKRKEVTRTFFFFSFKVLLVERGGCETLSFSFLLFAFRKFRKKMRNNVKDRKQLPLRSLGPAESSRLTIR